MRPDRIVLPPLSVLDLSPVPAGADSARALADTRALAIAADRLGYARFWVAEHHNGESVASTSPAVLIASLGAATSRIRLGSGGVMLPNHAPLAVAEQFAMLEALHPGRIDLGLGRAPGTDPITAAALRRGPAEEFPQQLGVLLALLGDARDQEGRRLARLLRATPEAASLPQPWLLGSSLAGAELAGRMGLRFAFAGHFGLNADPVLAAERYRAAFRPSPQLAEPYLAVSVSAITAGSAAEAELRSQPARVWRHQVLNGRPGRVLSPAEAVAYGERVADRELYERIRGHQLADTAERVAAGVAELAERTGADEVLLAATVHDVADRIRTLRELAPYLPDPGEGTASPG